MGFEATDAGPLRNARYLEPMGMLNIWFGYMAKRGMGLRRLGSVARKDRPPVHVNTDQNGLIDAMPMTELRHSLPSTEHLIH
jgi:hypothetical protein